MSKHFSLLETRSAQPLETRDDEGPGLDEAIAAVGELRTAATAFETRIAEQLAEVTTRLDEAEVRAQRPGAAQGNGEPSAETRAFADYLRYGDRSVEARTLTVSSDPQGGYLAPTEMSAEMIRDVTAFSPIRALATVRTTGAPSVTYPKRTAISNAKWKGETATSEASEPAFGQVEIPTREINTYVDISNQLLADSAGVAEAEVRMALAEDFGQKEGLSFISGSTVLEPEGILTNADVAAINSETAATITADALIDLYYGTPAAYRARGTWVLNSSTLGKVRKLKTADGQYLWTPGFGTTPETILGRPVVDATDMPDVGAGLVPVVFGDFATGYRIVDRLALSVLINPYLLATTGVTRVHATRRVGGAVVQPNALRKLKIAVTA